LAATRLLFVICTARAPRDTTRKDEWSPYQTKDTISRAETAGCGERWGWENSSKNAQCDHCTIYRTLLWLNRKKDTQTVMHCVFAGCMMVAKNRTHCGRADERVTSGDSQPSAQHCSIEQLSIKAANTCVQWTDADMGLWGRVCVWGARCLETSHVPPVTAGLTPQSNSPSCRPHLDDYTLISELASTICAFGGAVGEREDLKISSPELIFAGLGSASIISWRQTSRCWSLHAQRHFSRAWAGN